MALASLLNAKPKRFKTGDTVHVRTTAFLKGWPEGHTGKVIRAFMHNGFPHYVVADQDGNTYKIAQIHLSHSSLQELA